MSNALNFLYCYSHGLVDAQCTRARRSVEVINHQLYRSFRIYEVSNVVVVINAAASNVFC